MSDGVPLIRFCEVTVTDEFGNEITEEVKRAREQVFTLSGEDVSDAPSVVVFQRAQVLDAVIRKQVEYKLGCDAFLPELAIDAR